MPLKNPVKIPVQPEFDIRCKGTKTDDELLEEYFACNRSAYRENFMDCGSGLRNCHDSRLHKAGLCPNARWKAIEQELGKDRIQDDRLRRLESKMKAIPVLAFGLVAILVLDTILRFF